MDDRPQHPEKAVEALKHLQKLLTKKGVITLSFPTNYNSALMRLVRKNLTVYAFKRYDRAHNLWKQCNKEEIMNITSSPPEGIFLLQIKATDKL